MRKILLAFAVLFTAYNVTAQDVTPLSLNDCMEYAIRHNYTIKNSQVDIKIQDAQNKQTLAAAYPHINGKAEFDDFYVPQQSFIDASAFNFDPTAPKADVHS